MKKINQYIIIISIIFMIISFIGCIDDNKENKILTLKFIDYNAEYSLNDLKSIESFEGTGRFIKTKLLPESVIISESVFYTGVRLFKIFENIPNLPNNFNVNIKSSDNWTVSYTKDEIYGDVIIYDENGNILDNSNAVMILAYMENGKYYSEIDPNNEIGPLRIAFVEDNIITASNLWLKMVESVEIISLE